MCDGETSFCACNCLCVLITLFLQQQIAAKKTSFLKLETQPIQLGTLFFHQQKEIATVFKSYTVSKIVKCFVTGAAWDSRN